MNKLMLDLECYPNYFLALFTRDDGKSKGFEIFNDDRSTFDRVAIAKILLNPEYEIVTFNGDQYDMVLMNLSLIPKITNADLKKVSDDIIVNNKRSWEIYRKYDIEPLPVNHIDLKEVAIGMVSLKLYGGRMHSKKLQDLPLDPDSIITPDQLPLMRKYCKNDTLLTLDLYNNLEKQIELRKQMTNDYGVDLRSKSDAQIAEAVLKAESHRITKITPPKVTLDYQSFFFNPPAYIKFKSEELNSMFKAVCTAEMTISETGHVKMPKEIEKMKIQIGDSSYKLGIGGLHSQESEVAHLSDDEYVIIDRDVTSYYPNLMLNLGVYPDGFGTSFQEVYRTILNTRLEAKAEGNSVVSDCLKIVLNGTFGKTSNKYSTLYSPKLLITTTLTGQLSLLMLIEALEKLDFPVVSANTDGIVIKCPRARKATMDYVIGRWEKHTNLQTEETIYEALYSRDVNSYIAIKADGHKAKGVYGMGGLHKNPANEICVQAAIKYLSDKTPYEETIRNSRDIRQFVTVRTVTGGAEKDGEKLGKAIRWYYSTSTLSPITYVKNGNIVPRSEGAMPCLDLPDHFPTDIDYDWYIAETKAILVSIGALPRPVYEKIPRKNSKAWKALLEAGEIEPDRKGKYQWVNPEQHLGVIAA